MRRVYFIILFFLIFLGNGVHELRSEGILYEVVEVRENKLVYSTYKWEWRGNEEVDISDLIILPEIIGKGNPFKEGYLSLPDFKYLLIKNGYAKLKDMNSAPSNYISAQNEAKTKGIGIWRHREQRPSKKPFPSINWKKLINFLWKLVVALSTLGITTVLARHFYKKFYIQRRCKLLIIGEPYSGKTALLKTLINPRIEKEEILKLRGQSSGVTKGEPQTFIPRGKFEIYPSISDIPGHFYGTVWDNFFGDYSHSLIIVISTTIESGRNPDGSIRQLDPEKDINQEDREYISTQLGYIHSSIQGGLGTKYTKKPKSLIMYINKFDLFSKFPPDDSMSQKTRQVLEKLFYKHIEAASKAAKDIGIPFKVIFGSVIEKWNVDKVLDTVVNHLYGM